MKFFRMILPILVLTLYLGIHNGNLALFRQGHIEPLQVYPRSVADYPKKDQLALSIGIPITSSQQLTALLEAYLS